MDINFNDLPQLYLDLLPSLFFPENREDMLSPTNNKLTDVLEEANKLFAEGMIGSVIILPSFLEVTTDLT